MVEIISPQEEMMTLLAAIRSEKRKLEKQAWQIQHRLKGLETAAKALGGSAQREFKKATKVSAAARRKMSLAAKRRWKKIKRVRLWQQVRNHPLSGRKSRVANFLPSVSKIRKQPPPISPMLR